MNGAPEMPHRSSCMRPDVNTGIALVLRPAAMRRRTLCAAIGALLSSPLGRAQEPQHSDTRWHGRAEAMRQLAVRSGDQPYGAVLVTAGGAFFEAPSRVVKNSDPDAHSERQAILDAQRALGTNDLAGSVLYSTSRPCRLCEQAAARAGVSRMFFGAGLVDAGPPRL